MEFYFIAVAFSACTGGSLVQFCTKSWMASLVWQNEACKKHTSSSFIITAATILTVPRQSWARILVGRHVKKSTKTQKMHAAALELIGLRTSSVFHVTLAYCLFFDWNYNEVGRGESNVGYAGPSTPWPFIFRALTSWAYSDNSRYQSKLKAICVRSKYDWISENKLNLVDQGDMCWCSGWWKLGFEFMESVH